MLRDLHLRLPGGEVGVEVGFQTSGESDTVQRSCGRCCYRSVSAVDNSCYRGGYRAPEPKDADNRARPIGVKDQLPSRGI